MTQAHSPFAPSSVISFADLKRARVLHSLFVEIDEEIAQAVFEWAWPRQVFAEELERLTARDIAEMQPCDVVEGGA